MTIAQFIVAYSVCWWLVLFTLLPYRANPSQSPGAGHAPSAPANPMLQKKFILATFIAFVPTLAIYFVATEARAEDTIYHAGGGCHKSAKYVSSGDVAVKDGYGTGDKQVKPADLDGAQKLINTESMDIPLAIPSQNYIDRGHPGQGHNADLSESFINAGKLTVKQNGDNLLNGKSISNDALESGDCDDKK